MNSTAPRLAGKPLEQTNPHCGSGVSFNQHGVWVLEVASATANFLTIHLGGTR